MDEAELKTRVLVRPKVVYSKSKEKGEGSTLNFYSEVRQILQYGLLSNYTVHRRGVICDAAKLL